MIYKWFVNVGRGHILEILVRQDSIGCQKKGSGLWDSNVGLTVFWGLDSLLQYG